MNFENAFKKVLEGKPKPMSGYDYYKSIRKPTAKPGVSFKDKSKYSRKEKHKKDIHESFDNINYFKELTELLSTFGIKAYEQEPVLKLVQKALMIAYKEGYKACEGNPFKV